MQLMLQLDIPPLQKPISYTDKILLSGSCFTEHIADRLQHYKFHVLSNPHGILFNPLSVADTISGYISGKQYAKDDLFYFNELWNSWDHHTRFSDIDADNGLDNINRSQAEASSVIRQADMVIITLGSSFQYFLKDGDRAVANNHRAPAQWFEKRLLTVAQILQAWRDTLQQLFEANPWVQVMFTISPVRHIRDGVIENNRSKARLVDAVHTLCSEYERATYFPAYELVIDILRDYRYYDIDFVHPNYMATSYVWEQFTNACIAPASRELMQQVHEIVTARSHRPRFPGTAAHKKFMLSCAEKTKALMQQHPYLDMSNELRYFKG